MESKALDRVMPVLRMIAKSGGRPYVVGGFVRDKLLGLEPKDIDIEVYHLNSDSLTKILSIFGSVNAVGMSFGVLKLSMDGETYDFSLPRRESKQGKGHKGFFVEPDPEMLPRDAASRRDFTINAMLYDPMINEIIDFYNGQYHLLQEGYLYPTSEAFKEDPLRVLRAMQFAGRFYLFPSEKLKEYSKEIFDSYSELSVERIWEEWKKLCEKSLKPSMGLRLLKEVGWIKHYPELDILDSIPQDNKWHPEGDVWKHTLYCMDAAAGIAKDNNLQGDDKIAYMLAVICHDLGKAETTVFERDHWRSPGHDLAGVPLAEKFLLRIGCPSAIIERVKPLVRWHMVHCDEHVTKKLVRKLSLGISPATINELKMVVLADMRGRPPLDGVLPANMARIDILAEEIDVHTQPLKPILMGRHLIKRGWKPDPSFGKLLKVAFEAQVNGEFTDEESGKEWLENYILHGKENL